jgi:hypothetical protein
VPRPPAAAHAALTDALAKSTEQLQEAQQGLLALPLEGGLQELQQQAVCLAKLAAMQGAWEGTQFGYRWAWRPAAECAAQADLH